MVYLFRERSPAVADDGPGHRLEKKAVFLGYLVGGPHEDAAGAIPQVGVSTGGNDFTGFATADAPRQLPQFLAWSM